MLHQWHCDTSDECKQISVSIPTTTVLVTLQRTARWLLAAAASQHRSGKERAQRARMRAHGERQSETLALSRCAFVALRSVGMSGELSLGSPVTVRDISVLPHTAIEMRCCRTSWAGWLKGFGLSLIALSLLMLLGLSHFRLFVTWCVAVASSGSLRLGRSPRSGSELAGLAVGGEGADGPWRRQADREDDGGSKSGRTRPPPFRATSWSSASIWASFSAPKFSRRERNLKAAEALASSFIQPTEAQVIVLRPC